MPDAPIHAGRVNAYTLLEGESRTAFRSALAVDDATWARGRGWALWKALITLARADDAGTAAESLRTGNEVIAHHAGKA